MRIRLLIAPLLLVLSACNSSPPPAPPPAPVQSVGGGPTGGNNPMTQSPGNAHPAVTHATPVSTAKGAVNSAQDDASDWIDSSWKLFKSSLKSTFTVSSHQVRSPQGDINFTHYQSIAMDVSNIDIIDEYKSPMRAPNVEHLLAVSPSDAMHIWVKDRIRSVGSDRTLQVIIKDGSVVSSPVPAAEDAESHYRKYDARLEVEMRVYGSNSALSEASITVVATQSNSIAEEVSLAERKAIFRRMIYDLMDSANAELEKQMFKYFTRYINYAQTP